MDLGRAGVHTAARVLILADPGARARSLNTASTVAGPGAGSGNTTSGDGASDDDDSSKASASQERQRHMEALQRNADSASDALALHCLQTIRAILGAEAPPAIMELTRTDSVQFLSSTRQAGAATKLRYAEHAAKRVGATASDAIKSTAPVSGFDRRPALSRVTTQRMGSALLAVTAASEIRFAQHLRANPPKWTVGASLEVSGTEVPESERILRTMRADAASKAGMQLRETGGNNAAAEDDAPGAGIPPPHGMPVSGSGTGLSTPDPSRYPPKEAAAASRPARGQTPLLAFLLQQPKQRTSKLERAGVTQSRAHQWPAVDVLRQMMVYWRTRTKYGSESGKRSREQIDSATLLSAPGAILEARRSHAGQIGARSAIEWLIRAQLTLFELPFMHHARLKMQGIGGPGAVAPQSRIPSLAVATAARLHDESIQGFIRITTARPEHQVVSN